MKFPFRDFWEQVDSKMWRVHLLIFNSEIIWDLMITEGNKQKRQSLNDPALFFRKLYIDLLSKFSPES
jgi:hypothetical protein